LSWENSTFANGAWPGIFKKSFSSCMEHWKEANEWCKASLKRLKEILEKAVTESADRTAERLFQSVKDGGDDGIGKITQISFCLLAVHGGLVRQDRAKEQALQGFVSESSASSGKKLIDIFHAKTTAASQQLSGPCESSTIVTCTLLTEATSKCA
jgi:hypothetical protein